MTEQRYKSHKRILKTILFVVLDAAIIVEIIKLLARLLPEFLAAHKYRESIFRIPSICGREMTSKFVPPLM